MRIVLPLILATLAACVAAPDLPGSAARAQPVSQAAGAVNALRAAEGRAPLGADARLEQAALRHAHDMVETDRFAHEVGRGDLSARIARTGYGACRAAENLAAGHGGLAETLAQWMRSPGHRRNLLDPDVTGFGLVRVDAAVTGIGPVWVMVLGRPGC